MSTLPPLPGVAELGGLPGIPQQPQYAPLSAPQPPVAPPQQFQQPPVNYGPPQLAQAPAPPAPPVAPQPPQVQEYQPAPPVAVPPPVGYEQPAPQPMAPPQPQQQAPDALQQLLAQKAADVAKMIAEGQLDEWLPELQKHDTRKTVLKAIDERMNPGVPTAIAVVNTLTGQSHQGVVEVLVSVPVTKLQAVLQLL